MVCLPTNKPSKSTKSSSTFFHLFHTLILWDVNMLDCLSFLNRLVELGVVCIRESSAFEYCIGLYG